jgi:hypothetical protein
MRFLRVWGAWRDRGGGKRPITDAVLVLALGPVALADTRLGLDI